MIALRLSKGGYGTPSQILQERVDLVLLMIEYEAFLPSYEAAFLELNRETKGK